MRKEVENFGKKRKFLGEESGNEVGSIVLENEFKLMLYRHWSIYESMYFSNYLGTRLELWRNQKKKGGGQSQQQDKI